MDLLSSPSLVESPFIILKIGDYTFGNFEKTKISDTDYKLSFPNHLKSLRVNKINGAINNYEIQLTYQITPSDDPNLFEKVFGSVADTRRVIISYGDWALPNHIYKEEEGLIVNVTSTFSAGTSSIDYILTVISDAVQLNAVLYDFGATTAKPSDIIKKLIAKPEYGLQEVFKGMLSEIRLNRFIAGNDKVVSIPAKRQINILDYMNYLVSYMTNVSGDSKSNSTYHLTYHDDINNEFGGAYFKITEIQTNTKIQSQPDVYELDVGFPGSNFVTEFNVNNNQEWGILYEFSGKTQATNYIHKVDNDGNLVSEHSISMMRNKELNKITQQEKNWWTNMTAFPISATIQIKGLVRPTILMNYVKVNVYFFGNKSIYSGLYFITKQEDLIDQGGYRTTISLQRVAQDDTYDTVNLVY